MSDARPPWVLLCSRRTKRGARECYAHPIDGASRADAAETVLLHYWLNSWLVRGEQLRGFSEFLQGLRGDAALPFPLLRLIEGLTPRQWDCGRGIPLTIGAMIIAHLKTHRQLEPLFDHLAGMDEDATMLMNVNDNAYKMCSHLLSHCA